MSLYLGKTKIKGVSLGQEGIGISDLSNQTTTTLTGIIKGNNETITQAIPGVDYLTADNLTEYVKKNELNDKSNINSPIFTGTPQAPTPAINSNNKEIATTEYVNNLINSSIKEILNKSY